MDESRLHGTKSSADFLRACFGPVLADAARVRTITRCDRFQLREAQQLLTM